jgi:hypothetical protein
VELANAVCWRMLLQVQPRPLVVTLGYQTRPKFKIRDFKPQNPPPLLP